jgi:predicted permease
MIDSLWWDVRLAVRWLRQSLGFTLLAAASLALGIGFNTALFSVVDALLLRPLPVAEPDRLVEVYTSGSGEGETYSTSSLPDYRDLVERTTVFDGLVAHSAMFAAQNLGDRSRLVLGEVVSGNYFQVLGIGTALGRPLLPEDDRPGAERVATISERYWKSTFGGRPDVLAESIRLRGQRYQIVGVAQAGFTGMLPMLAPDIWVATAHVNEVEPAGIQDAVPSPGGTSRLDRRGQRWLFLKGRLKPGVTPAQAEAQLQALMAGLETEHPQTNRGRRIAVLPTRSVRVHPDGDGLLTTVGVGLMAAVALVLLIACANVACMLLARATARQKEISLRIALGAGRGRVIRQLLTESVLLSLLGATGGVALAWALLRALETWTLPVPIPVSIDLRLDGRVLAYTLGLSLAAGVLAGLAPALRSWKSDLLPDLRGDRPSLHVRGRRWALRDALVTGQIAVTVVLLVAASLLARSLVASASADVGFRTSGLAILSFDTEMAGHDAERGDQFPARARDEVRRLPGVEDAALAARLPFSLNFNVQQLHVPAQHRAADESASVQATEVSRTYFSTIGIPVVQGRGFTEADTRTSPRVAVVNETMARRFWPGQPAVGQRVHSRNAEGPAFEVVGVVADHRVQTVGEAPQAYVHFSREQAPPSSYAVLVARTGGDAQALLQQVRRTLTGMEPHLVFIDNQTMEMQVAATLLPVRAAAWVIGVVGLVGLLVASLGLYGVIAYAVARRTREIGIRMALGASASHVLGSVMRQGLLLAGTGTIAGALLAVAVARAVAASVHGVSAADPLTWTIVAAVVLGVAALANFVPARRAALVQPSTALRTE